MKKPTHTRIELDSNRLSECIEGLFDSAERGKFTDAEFMTACKLIIQTYEEQGCRGVLVFVDKEKRAKRVAERKKGVPS